MSYKSGFFEAVVDESGEYDRVYYAQQFADYFNKFIGNGVFANPVDQLKVEALGTNTMSVLVKKGTAFINGYWFTVDTNEEVTLVNASNLYPRWDAIVARCDMSERKIELFVKKGSYDDNPVKPAIVQTSEVYELCLAYIYVGVNAVTITAANIEDTRSDESICGFVAALIQQLDTAELFTQFTAMFKDWFNNTKAEVRNIVNAISSDPEGALAGFNTVFDAWFDTIKKKISDEPATNLQLQIDEISKKFIMYRSGFYGCETTFNSDGSITDDYEDGAIITTTFNSDGSITEKLTTVDKLNFTKTTTFTDTKAISTIS